MRRFVLFFRAYGLPLAPVSLLALGLTGLCGCSSTLRGLGREQQLYSAGTNVVSIIHRDVVPWVPPPYQGMLEGALAVAGAGLAAWNVHQQKSLKQLRNGVQAKVGPLPDKT